MSNEIVKAGPQPLAFQNELPVLRSSEDVKTLANLIVAAGWTKHSPTAACVAIMHGKSLGLNPWQAVQSIAVINGRPTLWGDGLVAVVQRSGQCEGIETNYEGEGDKLAAVVTVHRKGQTRPYSQRFSVADAKRAGLWDKAGPWKQYPQRMLMQRARSWALRDAFPDLLSGIIDREEANDYTPPPTSKVVDSGFADTEVLPPPPEKDIDDADAPKASADDVAAFTAAMGGGN